MNSTLGTQESAKRKMRIKKLFKNYLKVFVFVMQLKLFTNNRRKSKQKPHGTFLAFRIFLKI